MGEGVHVRQMTIYYDISFLSTSSTQKDLDVLKSVFWFCSLINSLIIDRIFHRSKIIQMSQTN